MTMLLLLSILSTAVGGGNDSLEQGSKALQDLGIERAIGLLERARSEGPYTLEEHVRLYEQLGIAYAYADRPADAAAMFDRLLALDPGHAVSYTLSPKVTFLFERARRVARGRVPTAIDLSWPHTLQVGETVPVTVELVGDPHQLVHAAVLHWRVKGAPEEEPRRLELASVGATATVPLGPVAVGATEPKVVDIYMTALDANGNEVLRVGDPANPREIGLRFEPEPPWYQHWWVWTLGGAVLAGGALSGIYLTSRPKPSFVSGTAVWSH